MTYQPSLVDRRARVKILNLSKNFDNVFTAVHLLAWRMITDVNRLFEEIYRDELGRRAYVKLGAIDLPEKPIPPTYDEDENTDEQAKKQTDHELRMETFHRDLFSTLVKRNNNLCLAVKRDVLGRSQLEDQPIPVDAEDFIVITMLRTRLRDVMTMASVAPNQENHHSDD